MVLDRSLYIQEGLSKSNQSEEILGYLFDDLSLQNKLENWEEALAKLDNGMPLQYATGIAYFYGETFLVDKNVLIPRPETEELVYLIQKVYASNSQEDLKILDIGTGSGCIPIMLKLLFPESTVHAIDVSAAALSVARINAKRLDAEVEWKELDFLDESKWKELDTYDIIVSNPPYIPHEETDKMGKDVVKHEPHLALFVEDDDPLIFYRKISDFAKGNLQKGGRVYLELNEFNAQSVKDLYVDCGYKNIQVHDDMQGKDRMLSAQRDQNPS